nr:metallophosphoesterase [Deltaproteobacteria bacterium]
MRAAWATDVHLEFLDPQGFERFVEAVRAIGPEALLLTGDIAQATTLGEWLRKVRAAVGVPVLFVLGNHDFYRGSIAEVKAWAATFHQSDEGLRWLPAAGPWRASDGTVVVGVDGWADGRAGAPERSTVLLNDWKMIRELAEAGAMYDLAARRARLAALADEDAARLEATLREVLPGASRVVVLTHIPPFEEACWHEGARSNDEWLPWFTCVAVGEVLRRMAAEHPSKHIEVYCGHTHSPGEHRESDNLVVHTGEGRYGATFVRAVTV